MSFFLWNLQYLKQNIYDFKTLKFMRKKVKKLLEKVTNFKEITCAFIRL